MLHYEVTPGLVAKVVSDWTGVPLGSLVREEARALLELEDLLKARLRGQDHAAKAVAQSIRANKQNLESQGKPIGVFLFVGPSGVGKTECALAVADLVFGGERFTTTINMSEFQEKHTVSRLVGSPPGYVGFGEGGRLTEAVRQRPYSVVLLDEVEKADIQVMNLFYQVFDKGVLADGEGRDVDFKNTVLFLTSNLASEAILELCAGGERPEPDRLAELIRPTLLRHFGDALLARMEVVPFFPLDTEALLQIAEAKLGQLQCRLERGQRIKLRYSQAAADRLAERGADIRMGARNIEFVLQREVVPRISALLLEKLQLGEKIEAIDLSPGPDGGFVLSTDG